MSDRSIIVKPSVASLPPYIPGRSVVGAIKLASNEVPGALLPSVATAIAEAATNINRYPDFGASALVGRLAKEYAVDVEQVTVGCGSVSLCQQLIQTVCEPGDEVIFPWRSFEAYPIITQLVGAQAVRIPLDLQYNHDLDSMLAAITPATKVVFICNPNNPTGTAVRREELERFLDRVPANVIVALDEAYREFVTDDLVPDGLDYVRIGNESGARPNVVVIRTFSKAYGLAGLRVGYSIASPEIITALGKVRMPFSVNALAQAAAIASLDAGEELRQRCAEIVAERERVRAGLLNSGFEVPESQGNFFWLPLAERTLDFAEHALDHKVVVRPFADGPTGGVRITIGHPEENDLVLDLARSFKR